MTTAGPWSVKGIDPKAREIAKDLARRSGLTLGEWLNQMIVDTSEGEAPPPMEPRPDPRTDPRLAPRVDPWAEPPAPLARGPEGFGAESFRARLQTVGRAAEAAELARVTRALNELAGRMEAAEHRSTLAISGIDQQVMGVLSRIEDGERDAGATAARFDGALDEVRAAQERIAARLARADGEDGPRVEAMKALEAALARMAAQIYEGEGRSRAQVAEVRQDLSGLARRVEEAETAARAAAGRADSTAFEAALARMTERLDAAEHKTRAAVAALETSFAGLDARVGAAGDLDARFAKLASDLQAKVEGDRAGMAERLRDAARDATGGDGSNATLDRVEASLRKLAGQVGEAEQRSAAAIDRMGHEIIRIASNMHGRMERVERSGAETVERMSEVARLAQAMEQRDHRADGLQAEALERLGGEIARIAETLSERIAGSERRTAQAMADLGEQMEGAAARRNGRYEPSPADGVRSGEERLAQGPAAPAPAIGPWDAAPSPVDDPADVDPFARIGGELEPEHDPQAAYDPFAALEAELARAPAPPAAALDPFPSQPAAGPEADPLASAYPATDPFAGTPAAPEPFDLPPSASEPFAPEPFAPEPFPAEPFPAEPFPAAPSARHAGMDEGLFAQPAIDLVSEDPADPRRVTTRDLIASARAAAREASETRNRRGAPRAETLAALPAGSAPGSALGPPPSPFPSGLGPLPPEPKRGVFNLSLPKRRRREAGTLRTIAYASGVAVTLTVAAVGAANLAGHAAEGQEGSGADTPGSAPAPTATPSLTAQATAPAPSTAPASAASTLAMAVSPTDIAPPTSPTLPAAADPAPLAAAGGSLDEAKDLYSAAVRRLESGDAAGLADLRKAANLGLPQAQFHLANLYAGGGPGLAKDALQARAWMARAAAGGEARAMFDLGLDYANGEGGGHDDRAAVAWFRRAADLGLRDAQFNLAVMNQDGRGTPKSAAEAYKWFLIAAASGDAGARSGADALKASLAPDALAAAERSAAAYRMQARATPAPAATTTGTNVAG